MKATTEKQRVNSPAKFMRSQVTQITAHQLQKLFVQIDANNICGLF